MAKGPPMPKGKKKMNKDMPFDADMFKTKKKGRAKKKAGPKDKRY